jgi:predicted transcriptional regulator
MLFHYCERLRLTELGQMRKVINTRSPALKLFAIFEQSSRRREQNEAYVSVYLNFMRFNRYLQELLDEDLIKSVGSNPKGIVLYRASDKGRELVVSVEQVYVRLSISEKYYVWN